MVEKMPVAGVTPPHRQAQAHSFGYNDNGAGAHNGTHSPSKRTERSAQLVGGVSARFINEDASPASPPSARRSSAVQPVGGRGYLVEGAGARPLDE